MLPLETRHRRAALAFIFVTVLLDMLALGMIAPVLPRLVVDFLGGDNARAAAIFGLFGTIWALMQLVCSPLLGAISDRIGRRPVILLSNLGLGLDYVLMAVAPTLGLLFVGRAISGITSATFGTAGAYIADTTAPEKRAGAFGLLGAAFGLGFVLGPAMGGVLGDISPRLPFWVAAGLSLLNAAYGFFVLPESLDQENRGRFAWRRANPVGSLGLLRSHPHLLGLAGASFLTFVAHVALPTLFVLYASYRYGWDARQVGLALAWVGIGSMVVAALTGPVVARLGERRTMLLGLLFGMAGFLTYGLAGSGILFLAGIVLSSLWSLSFSAAQSLMSRRVDPREQGRLQGAMGSLRGISELVGPGLFTLSFAVAIGSRAWQLPGTPFLIAALLAAAALGIAWWVTRPRSGEAHAHASQGQGEEV